MLSLNDVTILGRAGNTPKLYNGAYGKKYCQVPIYINVKSNEGENSTLVDCEAWGDLATIIDRLNIAKGQEILVKGRLRNRTNKNTNLRELCVVINDLKIFPIKQKISTEGENTNG